MPAKPSVKFQLIKRAAAEKDCMLSVDGMCAMSGVSRSGYYNWLNSEGKREERELLDRADFALILEAYNYRGYDKGARSIHMRLLHSKVRMNIKKIRRLMKKYGLRCKIRQVNAYKKMLKATAQSHVAGNIVQRGFLSRGVRKILLTDITYLRYRGKFCYLSTILDACTREVLAYEVSENMRVEFVIKTVEILVDKHGCTLDSETIIHSDQGVHYTSLAFTQMLRDEAFVQSMSRKGNCWDNAPQESFFGHMKDEIKGLIEQCEETRQAAEIVDDWMDYYNNERYQWELLKLAPAQYYEYCVTEIHPLEEISEDGKISTINY